MSFIDKVTGRETGKRLTATKNVTVNESFFEGHFPDQPIMPGILIIETMFQAVKLLLLDQDDDKTIRKDFRLKSVKNMRFLQSVVPGGELQIRVEIVSSSETTIVVKAEAVLGEKLAASGELILTDDMNEKVK